MKKLMFVAVLAAGTLCMTGCKEESKTEQAKSDVAAAADKMQEKAAAAADAAKEAAGKAADGAKEAAGKAADEVKKIFN